jgi:4-amino-4-deoxy-L-arabinose transferase-like glycosyltransferase
MSEAQTPGGEGVHRGRWAPNRAIAATAAIAVLAAVLLLNRLGASEVCNGNEAVEGVFLQRMVEHGELLFPLQNGTTPMYKPPLFHWTGVALDRLLGIRQVTPMDLRLPSALYGLGGIVLAMAFGFRVFGPTASVLAGLTLVASYQYIALGRIGRVDMTLTFFIALALFSFAWWLPSREASKRGERADNALLYLFALALGLAVLTKGPVGAILPLLAVAAFVVVDRRFDLIRALLEPGPALLGLAVASSWYLACFVAGKDAFLNRQLDAENFGRFFGALGTMPPWYYVKPLFLNSAPISVLAPLAVFAALRTARRNALSPTGSTSERTRSTLLLFALFWIITVLFFSIAAYKRRAYLLPLWPPTAVLLAWWVQSWDRWQIKPWWDSTWGHWSVGSYLRTAYVVAALGLVVFNFGYIPEREVRACANLTYRPAADEIRRVLTPDDTLYVYGFKEELAPLQFYLRRKVIRLQGRLGDAAGGYVLMPTDAWERSRHDALDFEPVLTSTYGNRKLVLVRRGKTYAHRAETSLPR